MKRDVISIADLSTPEIVALLDVAARLKAERKAGLTNAPLAGKALALLFLKPSLRTRLSFEIAMEQLGGTSRFLGPTEVGLGTRESVPDVARTLGCYVDAVAVRVFAHEVAKELAQHCPVPVISGLSDDEHPCQILADLLTLKERFGQLRGLTVAYVGDANNVANSLLLALPRLGVNLCLATPAEYEPAGAILEQAHADAKVGNAFVEVCRDPAVAVANADAVYADSWYSMGQEHEAARRRPIFKPYQINEALMGKAQSHTVAMHCLPAHRGDEITDGVLDGPRSVAFQQAENRLHAQKALLLGLLGTPGLASWAGSSLA
ncbi:MAG: ornithine carbamoyltransferase [Chloroflexi bacterium]|nr:ornithine carbamoyltransferase [Chloroflexota bacterium]